MEALQAPLGRDAQGAVRQPRELDEAAERRVGSVGWQRPRELWAHGHPWPILRISTPQSDELIKWVARADSTVTEEDVDISYPNNKQDVWRFAHNLYSILLSCTEDDAFRICHSVKECNGLEAMRLLMKRYEPRTPGTKRALLKAIINNPASKKPDELEKNLMKVEEYMHYEAMAGADLPEDLKVTVIIDLCTKDLKEHLELSTSQ